MKLIINLEEVETWDEATVAERIRQVIESEIERFIKALVKDALKEHEKQMRALVKRAAEQDWKRVAQALEALQQP